jgi:putative molybdenum carrier protein
MGQIRRVISGGQTGADRAALDVALELGIECGGWCPRGRKAEDGEIPVQYPLRQTLSPGYSQRTEKNITVSDGTLICNRGELTGGTLLTRDLARSWGKPCLVLDLDTTPAPDAADLAAEWIAEHSIATLNVAGPRASNDPEIYESTCEVLRELLM